MSDFKDLPTSGLLQQALELSYNDAASEQRKCCLYELHRRAEPEIFEAARSWCDNDDATKRVVAVDILAQLGPLTYEGPKEVRPFTRQTIPLLKELLNDPDARVVAAAVYGFGHIYFQEPIAEKASLATHSSDTVRFAVAYVLGGAKDPGAIKMLIDLSQDKYDDVRDWATFGLGCLGGLDTPEIREALFQRVSDNHFDTRSEALLGLALRDDKRVIPFIKAALEAEGVGVPAVEAAGEIASGDLVKALEALTEWWDVDNDLLHAALKRCQGNPSPAEEWRWNAAFHRDD